MNLVIGTINLVLFVIFFFVGAIVFVVIANGNEDMVKELGPGGIIAIAVTILVLGTILTGKRGRM